MTMPDESPESRELLQALYRSIRIVRLHRIETLDVREALKRLSSVLGAMVARHGAVELRAVRRSLYVGPRRVESTIENYVFYGHVLGTLQRAGVGLLRFERAPTIREWQVLIGVLISAGPDDAPSVATVRKLLSRGGVQGVAVEAPDAAGLALPGEEEQRAAAKRTYQRSVAVSRELFQGARLGVSANVREVRHAVENIVDAVLHDEASLGGLSTLKDYDEYAFTHSVNVSIFCVAIGRRLGLTKAQLYDLGLAALVHDIGMSRIPREILTKRTSLTPDEQAKMETHTWRGALSAFRLRDFGEVPYQAMIVAYEHHMKPDGTGYPRPRRARESSIFSKIIAVAAAFDAATNERSYSAASPPDEVLRELWEDKSLGHDPVVVKALINLLGIYPVGTCVILDTYELAIVHSANTDAAFIHRPIVRLLCDANGLWLSPAPLVDLAETDANGDFSRSIIKVTSADKYGIKVSDYFV